ncbi:MAG: abortive phage infection protein [Spirochaetae bacterium HGW-Spirochaetae-8]|jgi:hypothetical protein|nr:MAG: abortive phage infection protein [Spirochaetae bacterium HGW-Spirochaetae-8]
MFDNHKKPTNLFKLLCNKSIIEILDGDTEFGEMSSQGWGSSIKISMPYLSGPAICGISTRFGLAADYPRTGGAQSRWSYFKDLLKHCIDNNQTSELLAFLFSKNQFTEKLKGLSPSIIDATYKDIVEKAIENINSVLYFSGNELIVIGETFSIRTIGTQVTVAAPAVKQIDRGYIKDLGERALKDIEESNCDSAITKSRTLLEEVFCYVIEKKNETPSSSGDIGKLYNQVKTLYKMHQDGDTDKRINMLLSGLEKIVNAIAQMRNEISDSHGVGSRRISIKDYHALLAVNSAITMANFILSVGDSANDNQRSFNNYTDNIV